MLQNNQLVSMCIYSFGVYIIYIYIIYIYIYIYITPKVHHVNLKVFIITAEAHADLYAHVHMVA